MTIRHQAFGLLFTLGLVLGCPQNDPAPAAKDDGNGWGTTEDGGNTGTLALVLTGVLPTEGPAAGGTQLIINGRGMRDGLRVFIQGQAAPVVALLGDSTLVVTTPPGMPGGADVRVINPDNGEAFLTSAFTYTDELPGELTVTRAVPSFARPQGGDAVVILGTGFMEGARVFFGVLPAASTERLSDEVLLVTTPPAAERSTAVSVENPGGARAVLSTPFQFVEGGPGDGTLSVANVLPSSGPAGGGTRVAVIGTGFTSGLTVAIGGVQAPSVEVRSPSVAIVTTPAGAVGAATVTLSQSGSAAVTLQNGFTYQEDRLVLADVVPDTGSAAGGTDVALVGSGFHDGMQVLFGTTAATNVQILSSSAAIATTPAGAVGAVDVTLVSPSGPTSTLAGAFTYSGAGALQLLSVSPDTGPLEGGVPVVLSGDGLDRLVGQMPGTVTFGGNQAEILELVSSEALVVRTPPGAAGAVEVVVQTADGTRAALADGYTYADVATSLPEITGVTPRGGPAAGGTRLAIHGRALGSVTAVRVGAASATEVSALGATVISATTPAGAPGAADVTVVLAGGQELVLRRAFFFFQETSSTPPPTVTSISPAMAPIAGGTPFVISGTRFDPQARVLFGGVDAQGVRRLHSNMITGMVPAGTRAGAVDVVVLHPDGKVAALSNGFTYFQPDANTAAPTLAEVRPPTASSLGGTQLTLVGTGFGNVAQVLVDQVPATDVSVSSATRILCKAPAHGAGPVAVSVVNDDGTFVTLEGALTYVAEAPTITEVLPQEGPTVGHTGLTIRGVGFAPGAQVMVGSNQALDVVVLDPSLLMAVTPAGPEGAVDITVINPGGLSAQLTAGFSYFSGAYDGQGPVLTSISPATAPPAAGSLILITGENLRDGAQLFFGGAEATSVTVISPTEATVVVPPHAPGPVDVVWLNPDGQSAVLRGAFNYADPLGVEPTINGLAPNRGPAAGGTPAVLAGAGFTQDTLVFFGRVPARNAVSLNEGFVSLITPAHAAGVVDVTATTLEGLSTTVTGAFTFVPSPTLTAVSPAVGPLAGGTTVLIGGTNFQVGASVLFGNTPAVSATVSSPTVISAVTPARPEGPVDVVVRNPDGQQVMKAAGFEFLDLPTITGVWPPSGPSTGGTRVVLSGTRLRNGVQVRVGGTAATGVVWVADGEVSFIMPAGAIGPVDIEIINPDGQRASLAAAFNRVDPATLGPAPTVAACFPSAGHISGGTAVRVTGTGFMPGSRVFFSGASAVSGYMDGTQLAARTPARPAGASTVDVTLPNGLTATRAACFTYRTDLGMDPGPLVNTIQPAQGPTNGGADVVISGDHFQSGAVVLIGNRLASSITFVGPTRLEARTPPGTEGAADVIVANPDGKTATLPGAYTYLPPPEVTAVTPSEGPSVGGTEITINGAGFLMGAVVRVGGVQATNVMVVSDLVITASTPPGQPGVADVTVVNADGQVGTLPAAFAYTPPPVIASVDPTSGSTLGGQWVRVLGSGFRALATVDFGTQPSPEVQVLSGTELRARTPAGEAGIVAVKVTNVDGYSDTLPLAFTYVPPPTILTVAPTSGPQAGGTSVTILGSGFQQGAEVYFGTTRASQVNVLNPSTLEVTTPARAAGAAAVRVVNPDTQEAVQPFAFTFLPPIPPPTVTSVSPNFGSLVGGTLVTITGNDFQYGATVYFGDTVVLAAHTTVLAATQIRVRVPGASADGPVGVRVVNPDAQEHTLANGYTYLPALALPPLGLTAITPNRSGLDGGVRATVLGNGMSSDVQFFAVKDGVATDITVVRYFSPVAVQVELPAVTGPGLYDLRAVIPSNNTQTTLAGAIEYRDLNLTFTTRRGRVPAESRDLDQYPLVADLNLDGFNDVYVPREHERGVILQNRGSAQPGYFDDVSSVNLLGEPNFSAAYLHQSGASVATDVTLDGWPDIISWVDHYTYDQFRIRQSQGYGKLRYGPAFPVRDCVNDWVIGDIDLRDGPDILVCTCAENYWMRNRGVLKDANGDVINDANGVPLWKGFDRMTFTAVVNGTPRTPSEDTRGCDLGDVDNDGDLDVHLANAGNVANRLYLNDVSTSGPTNREASVDEFDAANWSRQHLNASASAGVYTATITNVSDPYIYRDVSDFSGDHNHIQLRYQSYTNGPTQLTLYYTDNQDCSSTSFNSTCSQTFDLVADGEWHTLDALITDLEWNNVGTIIRYLRLDFEGATATGDFLMDHLRFYGSFLDPVFVDVSGSPMFSYAGDSRSSRFVDLDHDGDLDIVTINFNQDDYILFNTTDTNGNQVFLQNPSALCHDEACSLAGSSPPLNSRDLAVTTGPDRRMRVAGDPMNPAQKYFDFNRDGCVDLMVEFDTDSWIPRIYLNKKIGDAPQGCTGQFFYTPTDGSDINNPLRHLYHGGIGNDLPGFFGRDLNTTYSNPPSSFGDLDGDGWMDMFQVFRGGQDRVYIRKPVEQDGNTYMRLVDSTLEGIMPRDGNRCRAVDVADINEDGAPDLITHNWAMCEDTDAQVRSRVYLNDGAGNFSDASHRLPFVRARVADQVVADFNGDGHVDVLAVNRDQNQCGNLTRQITLFQNDGAGNFTNVTPLTALGHTATYYDTGLDHALAVDVDNDGDLDITMTGDNPYDANGRRRLFINGGDPFNQGAPFFFDRSSNLPDNDGRSIAAIDFNRDGRQDLYVARNGQNRLYRNEGSGSFSDVTSLFMNQLNDNSHHALVARFTGSTYSDIFVVNDAQTRRLHVGRSDNTLADLTDSNIRPGADARRSFSGRAVDLDEDGLPDVVMPAYNDRNLLYLNIGNGVFEDWSATAFPDDAFDNTRDVALADFDGDGDLDMFLCNDGQQNRLMENNLR